MKKIFPLFGALQLDIATGAAAALNQLAGRVLTRRPSRNESDKRFDSPGRLRPALWAFVASLTLAACASAEPRVFDRDPSLPETLPFSSAVVVGDTIYLAGEIGRKPGTVTLVEGGVGPETEEIFENYKLTLARVGASLDDIVKCTVFLDDMSTFAEMNAAYVKYFPGDKPARSTFGVDGLAYGAALEIECLAVKK